MGLIVFDLDGVLINEYLPELAKLADKEKEVSEITRQGLMEEIDWRDGLRKRIALLEGLSIKDAKNVANKMEYHEGVVETFRQLKKNGHTLAVITGGFDVFEERLNKELGMDFVIANKFIVNNGHIEGIDITVDEHKEKNLEKLLDDLRINKEDVMMVGDGANDIEIFKNVGYAIGLNPKDKAKPFINYEINDIRELVPITNELEHTMMNDVDPMKKLFVPGPVDVSPDVLKQMGKPIIYHRGKEFSELLTNCVDKLKKLTYTKNNIFISTSSSTGLMEAAVRNCVKDRCLNIAVGAFGERWHQIALANGKSADLLKVEWGKAATPDLIDEKLSESKYDSVTLVHNETSTGIRNPIYEISKVVKNYDVCFLVDTVSSMGGEKIEVDKLGIDVCLFGSQKALSLPPGISICSVSDKALKRAETVLDRGYYFDFLVFHKYLLKGQTPTTPAIPQMNAMNYQLDRILEEGLEERFKRHREMGEITRKWAKAEFELFADEEYASNTLTCIRNSKNIDIDSLISSLKKRGYLISNGYGKLRGKTFRIAHMGDRTIGELKILLDNMNEILVRI